ncbi:MAG: hypothetical protein PUJ57_03270 [Peptoniphilaceae bacterium]|nr:hypothetical protein [Peptoniphilaceae bacterium]MDY6085817.1 hypothetical protein [Peptoniphilaceae bacterium]
MRSFRSIALALFLSAALVACDAAPKQTLTAPVDATVAAESVETQQDETSAETSQAETTEAASAAQEAAEEAGLQALAQKLAETPVGTAGSSLAIVTVANEALPLGEALRDEPDVFVEAFIAETEDEDPALREELLAELMYTVDGLVRGDEATLRRADDAGVTVNESALSADEWATVSEGLTAELAK